MVILIVEIFVDLCRPWDVTESKSLLKVNDADH